MVYACNREREAVNFEKKKKETQQKKYIIVISHLRGKHSHMPASDEATTTRDPTLILAAFTLYEIINK